MTSLDHRPANRANAAKCTGSRTPEGEDDAMFKIFRLAFWEELACHLIQLLWCARQSAGFGAATFAWMEHWNAKRPGPYSHLRTRSLRSRWPEGVDPHAPAPLPPPPTLSSPVIPAKAGIHGPHALRITALAPGHFAGAKFRGDDWGEPHARPSASAIPTPRPCAGRGP